MTSSTTLAPAPLNEAAARPATMRAMVYATYGPPDVITSWVVNTPEPADDEVLVRVSAAALNPADWHLVRGEPYFVRLITGLRAPRRPTVLGADVAGLVEAVGPGVTSLRVGDSVFGRARTGHCTTRDVDVTVGACAEFACIPESLLERKPDNATFEQAAALPLAGLTALQALRDSAMVRPGQRVLINGAAGGTGTCAVQIAKSSGAHVTGVCSMQNVELVRSLGADDVIDYTAADFADGTRSYDVILDLAHRSLADCRRALTANGTVVVIGGAPGRWVDGLARAVQAGMQSPFVSQQLRPFTAKDRKEDLTVLKDLVAAGTLTPVIDRVYPLADAAQALRYLEAGHAHGKVVITI